MIEEEMNKSLTENTKSMEAKYKTLVKIIYFTGIIIFILFLPIIFLWMFYVHAITYYGAIALHTIIVGASISGLIVTIVAVRENKNPQAIAGIIICALVLLFHLYALILLFLSSKEFYGLNI